MTRREAAASEGLTRRGAAASEGQTRREAAASEGLTRRGAAASEGLPRREAAASEDLTRREAAASERMTRRVAVASVTRLGNGAAETDQDLVAVESPLSLVVIDANSGETRSLGLLMRTPGDDADLVLGLLYAERILSSPGDVTGLEIEATNDRARTDVARVTLAAHVQVDWTRAARGLDATSACGLCGRVALPPVGLTPRANEWTIDAAIIAGLPALLRGGQAVFEETGGLHAAAIFSSSGELRAVREDVGRHNAVDKIVGALFHTGRLPAFDALLAVSGRVAYEIVQKAAAAGIPVLVAVGAPSSLAIEASRSAGMTLIGFARDGRFNVYAGEQRLRRRSDPGDSSTTG